MPRSPMVPVRSDLHGSLAAARPQLRKLCALLGKEESAKLFASPALSAAGNGSVSAEAALACLLGRLAAAFGNVLDSSSGSRSVTTAAAVPRARKVRRGRGNRAHCQQQPQLLPAQVQPAPECGGPAVMVQPRVSCFPGAGWSP